MVIISCNENGTDLHPIDSNALRVAGNYKATTFILPGSDDGPVDILANGGTIAVELSLTFTAKGRVYIPKHPNLRGDGFDEFFNGTYTVKNDSLQFKNMNNILSHPQLFFVIKEKKLEAYMEGISSEIIVLEKQ